MAAIAFGKARLDRVAEQIESHYQGHAVIIAQEQDGG
jgi:hypothetical protein